MRSTFIILLFSAISFNYLFSQTPVNLFEKEKSVNFYFINGYAFAYKFKDFSNSSLRLLFDISSNLSDSESDYKYIRPQSPDENENSNNKSYSYYFNFSPQYLYNFFNNENAKFYFGGGPFVSAGFSKSESEQTEKNPLFYSESIWTNVQKNKNLSTGLTMFLGVEGKVTKAVGVFAETHLSGGRSWGKSNWESNSINRYEDGRTDEYSNSNDVTSDSWFYNLTNIRVGLSVHF